MQTKSEVNDVDQTYVQTRASDANEQVGSLP